MTVVGIAGAGRMGTAFAARLIETGNSILIWNRTPTRTDVAAKAGAHVADDLVALADADVILISLTDAAAVQAVADDLISTGIAGKLVIDLSTVLPDETRSVATRIIAADADFVDCPVGGTVAPALKGQLLGMAGGSDAAFARAKPILEQLCRRVEHLGPPGSGSQMKLAINLPLALYWQTLAESLTLLKNSGIPTEMAISLIADSSAGPTVLKNRAQVVVDSLAGTDQPGTFDIAGLSKDLHLALRWAKGRGDVLPMSQAAGTSYERAQREGLGRFDGASLTRLLLD